MRLFEHYHDMGTWATNGQQMDNKCATSGHMGNKWESIENVICLIRHLPAHVPMCPFVEHLLPMFPFVAHVPTYCTFVAHVPMS